VQLARLDLLGPRQQLGGAEPEPCRQSSEARVAGVALAGLDVTDPALVQAGVVGERLLGDPALHAAGLDGEAEGRLEGWGGGHAASLPAARSRSNDIAVDKTADNALRSPP